MATEADATDARPAAAVSRLMSARFRLTLVYSTILFGLAALVLGLLYWALAASLDDEPVHQQWELQSLEELVNERALDQLRDYSFSALILLFFASLGVGWFVAGHTLAPIHRITAVARDIQATDLKRRIRLGGPNDELRELADTFDQMLERIDEAFESQRRFIHEASHELRNPL